MEDEEIFELARQRFLESAKLTPQELEEAILFNKDLHTLSVEEMFRRFTI